MLGLRSLAITVFIVLATTVVPAMAGPILDYDAAKFRAAQDANKRIMVIVASNWDVASQAQKPSLETISRDFLYPDVAFFRVDWNRQQDVARQLRVRENATVLVFKGPQERARRVGEVNEMELRDMLGRAQ